MTLDVELYRRTLYLPAPDGEALATPSLYPNRQICGYREYGPVGPG